MKLPQYIVEKINENKTLNKEWVKLSEEIFKGKGVTVPKNDSDEFMVYFALELQEEWFLEQIERNRQLLERKNTHVGKRESCI